MNPVPEDDDVEVTNVESLTVDLFSKLLETYYQNQEQYNPKSRTIAIRSMSIQPVEQGVLSRVYKVTLEYADHDTRTTAAATSTSTTTTSNNNNNDDDDVPPSPPPPPPPCQWIVKLRRPDLPLQWMFDCESTFYKHFAPALFSTTTTTTTTTAAAAAADKSKDSGKNKNNVLRLLPFDIPRILLYASKDCIIVECIPNVTCHALSGGCPDPETFLYCLDALAQWHATCWKHSVFVVVEEEEEEEDANKQQHQQQKQQQHHWNDKLSCPPGIGQRLSGLQKEHLFRQGWKTFVKHALSSRKNENDDDDDNHQDATPPTPKVIDSGNDNDNGNDTGNDTGNDNGNDTDTSFWIAAHQVLQQLEPLRLRDVHDRVHASSCTCVHGDYHIANWLFPNNSNNTSTSSGSDNNSNDNNNNNKPSTALGTSDDSSRKPVLVDWATCGYGNPMIDLVFFLIVSTKGDEIVSDIEPWLRRYYNILTTTTTTTNATTTTTKTSLVDIDYETCQEWFGWCLINQLLILVAYDDMCRSIALAEIDLVQRQAQLDHFQNVNRRILLAVVQLFGSSSNSSSSSSSSNGENKNHSSSSSPSSSSLLSSLAETTLAEQHEASSYSETHPLFI